MRNPILSIPVRYSHICPKCGNKDEYYDIEFIRDKTNVKLRPYAYYYATGSYKSLINRIRDRLNGTVYIVDVFRCPKCGYEWETEPIKVIKDNSKEG